jgi:hypothetical protein
MQVNFANPIRKVLYHSIFIDRSKPFDFNKSDSIKCWSQSNHRKRLPFHFLTYILGMYYSKQSDDQRANHPREKEEHLRER